MLSIVAPVRRSCVITSQPFDSHTVRNSARLPAYLAANSTPLIAAAKKAARKTTTQSSPVATVHHKKPQWHNATKYEVNLKRAARSGQAHCVTSFCGVSMATDRVRRRGGRARSRREWGMAEECGMTNGTGGLKAVQVQMWSRYGALAGAGCALGAGGVTEKLCEAR